MAKESSSKNTGDLRKRAESILAQNPDTIRSTSHADVKKLIQELNVHQIELEMQNAELRRVQLELQETHNKYQSLFDFAPTGYFNLDPNYVITEVNLTGSELLGSEKQRLIGTQFTVFISPDSQDIFFLHFREMFKTGRPSSCELQMQKADGTPFHAQLISTAIPGKDGNINHFRTAVIDTTERKKAEEMLHRTEDNFRQSLDNSPLGIRIVNSDGEEIYANQAMLDIYGYASIEELKATPRKNSYTPESYAEFQVRKKKRQRGEYVPSNYEISIVRKDGEIRRLEVFRKEVFWDGKLQFQSLYNDITEHIKVQEALRQSEARHRTLFETMTQGVIYQNAEGHIVSANAAAVRILGLTLDQMQGKTSADPRWKAIHEDGSNFPGDTHPAMDSLRTGKEVRNEIMGVFHHDKNEYVWINISATPNFMPGETKPYQVYTTFEDITERRKANQTLNESEKRYRALFESAAEGIMITDTETRKHKYANPAMCKLLGYSQEELTKLGVSDIHPKTSMEKVVAAFNSHAKGAQTFASLPCLKKDGTIIYTDINATSAIIDGRQCNIGIFSDITERKNMQAQLMAQDRLASIGQLVAGVAHEINNPLTAVIGFSELLLKRTDVPQAAREDLKIINDEAQRTAKIVQNLLTFARKQPEGKAEIKINEPVERVITLRGHEQKVNSIRVITHFASDLPQVMGNNSQLQQVFFNLVINAEFFMAQAHQKGNLTITTERIGDCVRASVTDDGPGISEDNLKQLFTPFFTTKDVGKGTGLGLSISYGIVTEHGGRIWAESELGRGATFIVELPICKAAAKDQADGK